MTIESKDKDREEFLSALLDKNLFERTGLSVKIQNKNKLIQLLNGDRSKPILILLSGTSESGKSHFSLRMLEAKKASRVKIHKVINDLQLQNHLPSTSTPEGIINKLDISQLNLIVNATKRLLTENGAMISTVESFKNSRLVGAFEESSDLRSLSIFVDANLSLRTSREATKEMTDIADTRMAIIKKDREKRIQGVELLRSASTLIIDNSGDLQAYDDLIDMLSSILITRIGEEGQKVFEYK